MYQVIQVVAPIFALIALGYFGGRFGWVGKEASKGLADFTFNLAIPAMLFRTMATTPLPDVEVYRLWGAFFAAAFAIWLIAAAATRWFLARPAEDGPSIAMSAGFGNVVMLGLPISLMVFGPKAAAAAAVIVSLHSPVLWILATLHLAIAGRAQQTSIVAGFVELVREISRNVIILAILAGTLWRASGLELPFIADQSIKLLGQAGIPCALVALGLSLVGFQIKGQAPTLGLILTLKIVVMPLIAWVLAVHVFALPALEAGIVTIFAAMPTGANAYLFASRHKRAMNSASGAVALGTAVSTVTAAIVIYALASLPQ